MSYVMEFESKENIKEDDMGAWVGAPAASC